MKVDLSKKFEAALAECSNEAETAALAQGYVEALREQFSEADKTIKTQAERLELLEKGSKEIKDLNDGLKKANEELRANNRQTPDPGEAKGAKIDLSSIKDWQSPLGNKPSEDKGDLVASMLGKMPVDQFNLTCRSPQSLGIDPKSATGRAIDRYQALSDFEALLIPYVARKKPELFAEYQKHPLVRERIELGKKLQDAAKVALADDAMATGNTNYGGNWVRPEVLSSRVIDYVENERVLLRFFEEIPMSTKTMSLPVLGSVGYPVRLPENVDLDGNETNATLSPTNFTTLKATFTARGYGHSIVCTPWWFEDGIVAADYIARTLARWMNRGEERWLVNGQGVDGATGNTIDTAAPSGTDIRLMNYGLRYFAKQVWDASLCSPVDLGGTLTGDAAAKIFGRQGRYAHKISQSIFLVSPVGMTACLLLKTQEGHNLVQTYSELGRPGTVQSGVLAQLYGRPIVVSDEVSETMDASGYGAVGGSATAIYHVYTDAVKVGRRTGMAVEFSDQYRFLQHQDVFKVTARMDIEPVLSPTTEPFINAGVNLSSAL